MTNVSQSLANLIDILQPFYGQDTVELEGEGFDSVVDGLRLVRRLALAQERELGAWRVLEAGRYAKGEMEAVATGALGELVLDPEGKVVRPDFGRRS